jgi:hypothetical protein
MHCNSRRRPSATDSDALPGTHQLALKYRGMDIPAVLDERTDLVPEFIEVMVRQGVSFMPQFRKTEISDEELDALSAYLTRTIGAVRKSKLAPPRGAVLADSPAPFAVCTPSGLLSGRSRSGASAARQHRRREPAQRPRQLDQRFCASRRSRRSRALCTRQMTTQVGAPRSRLAAHGSRMNHALRWSALAASAAQDAALARAGDREPLAAWRDMPDGDWWTTSRGSRRGRLVRCDRRRLLWLRALTRRRGHRLPYAHRPPRLTTALRD